MFMINYMSERYSRLLDDLEQSALLTVDQKIERFREQTGRIPKEEKISVSETVIAWAIGAHPVSVCRALNAKAKVNN